MLTKEAFNALLKTLEEPPAHVIFILATTEEEKLLDTILSRCQVFRFNSPSRAVLSTLAVDVAKKEGFTLARPAADLVALLAEGSFRDSLSILQKVLAVSKGKTIEVADVETVSGAPRSEIVRSILGSIAQKDAAGAIAAMRTAVKENMDARMLAKLVIHRLRVALLMRYAPALVEELAAELTETDQAFIKEISQSPTINSDTLKAFLNAYSTMAYAAVPHLPLELAIIDICSA